MAHLLAQVRFNRTTNVPEDDVINTFHFSVDEALYADLPGMTALAQRLVNFYRITPPGQTNPVKFYMGGLASTGHRVMLYRQEDPTPRAPRLTLDFSETFGVMSLPAEVALCLSFRGPNIPGGNPARRRGRVYIGPMASTSLGVALNGDIRPLAVCQGTLADAGVRLATEAGPEWVIWSPTDATVVPISHLWVDNAYDTQRRRGSAPTSRITRDV